VQFNHRYGKASYLSIIGLDEMSLDKTEAVVLENLASHGGTGNVMEFLNYSAADFDKAFDFANNLQNKDMVKLLYSNYNKNLVVVELTLLGFQAWKKDK